MKLYDHEGLSKALDKAAEATAAQLNASRATVRDGLACGDAGATFYAAVALAQAEAEMSVYRRVLDLLDQHTFDLRNKWGRYDSYLEGQEPPSRPPFGLAAKVQALADVDGFSSHAMAALVLVAIKNFNDWLEECWCVSPVDEQVDIPFEDRDAALLREIVAKFHILFGRPGLGQKLPDWARKSYAWTFQEEGLEQEPLDWTRIACWSFEEEGLDRAAMGMGLSARLCRLREMLDRQGIVAPQLCAAIDEILGPWAPMEEGNE
jgi:hypothetical protein